LIKHGFGLVYKGNRHDERDMAVKILKGDDQHGDYEFFAESDMLSRLNNRNLVKFCCTICTGKPTR